MLIEPETESGGVCGALPISENRLCPETAYLPGSAPKQSECRSHGLLFQFVNQMVAVAFELKPHELIDGERGNLRRSRARQIAMYLMNVALSRTFMEIGNYYGRDRTTVSHACRVVDSLRDIPAFDDRLEEFEKSITLVLSISGSPGTEK